MANARLKIGISACLAGMKTRYDGTDRFDEALTSELGRAADLIPVCPEVECGLGVPREEMWLSGSRDEPRLVCRFSGTDQTSRMIEWAGRRIDEFIEGRLAGFVLKSRSPSCGLSVELHRTTDHHVFSTQEAGKAIQTLPGLFSAGLKTAMPDLPIVEETAFGNPDALSLFLRACARRR